jgi:protein-S-isoprenylcysteine O-methyltransferase Ste14
MGWIVPGIFGLGATLVAIQTLAHAGDALSQHTTRAWLVVAYGILRTCVLFAFAVFTIGRAAPRSPSRDPVAFVACAAAMATVLIFAGPARSTPESLLLGGELVALASCAWLLVSVLFLGRCFGVLPEARGLVTRGPYGLVRHPVYLGEIGACAGLALAAPSLRNAVALAAVLGAQTVRMRMEERALTAAFPAYASYAACTPRLLPRPGRLGRAMAFALAGTTGGNRQARPSSSST